MARGRDVPTLTERWHLKNKVLVKKWKGQVVVQSWPKPYGPARSQKQQDTQTAFKRVQRALKTIPPQFTIAAMAKTKGTGMYPRDILMQGMTGTNILLAYEAGWPQPMMGDGLFKFTANGGETTCDFTGIPQGYSALQMEILARTLSGGSNEFLTFTINGDSAAHYDRCEWWNSGSAFDFAVTSGKLADINGNGASANYASAVAVHFPGYTNTAFYKSVLSSSESFRGGTSTTVFPIILRNWWRSTAAVNRITITAASGFKAGSQITLYGLF